MCGIDGGSGGVGSVRKHMRGDEFGSKRGYTMCGKCAGGRVAKESDHRQGQPRLNAQCASQEELLSGHANTNALSSLQPLPPAAARTRPPHPRAPPGWPG